MKGDRSWCIVCLTLLGLVVPLFLTSSDVSALKYAYNAFPLYDARYESLQSFNPTFGIYFDNSQGASTYDDDLIDNGRYTPRHLVSGLCENQNYTMPIWSQSNVNGSYQSFVSGYATGFYRTFDNSNACYYNQVTYTYDSVYSSEYNLSNGDLTKIVNIPNLFFDSDDTFYDNGKIKRIDLPVNIDTDSVSIPANTPLEWEFIFGNQGILTPESNMNYELSLRYYDGTNTITDTATCSSDLNRRFEVRGEDMWESYVGFGITCSYTPTSKVDFIVGTLTIYGGNDKVNPQVFLTYGYANQGYANLYFAGSYLVTNNDDTWSGQYANKQPTGTNLENAPGYHQLYGYDYDTSCNPGDWFCDLTNLFGFTVINPFSPIFTMFEDNSTCVNIPTIAGMIHSEETQICPWFDSTTRNIVTPVLSLSAMMLLFGFAIRWLSSSSGNFEADTTQGGSVNSGIPKFHYKFGRKIND